MSHSETSEFKVHKTLFVSDNLDTLKRVSNDTTGYRRAHRMGAMTCLFTQASNGELNASTPNERLLRVSLVRAKNALTKMRKSSGDPDIFAEQWKLSNFNKVLQWLRFNAISGASNPPIVYGEWIRSFLEYTRSRILNGVTEASSYRTVGNISDAHEFRTALQTWSENAHCELQDGLEPARLGRIWKTLAWWKLPLRSDDVSMYLTDILERFWLVNAEKELLWLSGRLEQAGFSSSRAASAGSSSSSPPATDPNALSIQGNASNHNAMIPLGTPILSEARSTLATTSISPLAAQAQAFVVNAGSKTFFTSALATLVYLSPPLAAFSTFFEAGAVATLGLVYSLYRLQRQWEAARSQWLTLVRQQGRATLRELEERLRRTIDVPLLTDQKLETGLPVSGSDPEIASAAVSRVEAELKKVMAVDADLSWGLPDATSDSSASTTQKIVKNTEQDRDQPSAHMANDRPLIRYTGKRLEPPSSFRSS